MKSNRRHCFLRVVSLALCVLLALSLCPRAALAKAQTLQKVRVGFFAFNGYHMVNDEGARSGYGYELLMHLAGYTDWQYEYVGYDKSWSDMQTMLERGEIDLLTSAQKTDERMARFDFSDESVGSSAAILTVPAGDTTYAYADYANWSGMRVGMLKNNSRNDSFAAFAEEQGFTYEPLYFDSTEAMLDALRAGELVDAALTSNLRSISDEWILAQFDVSPFYIMVRKGNTALLDELNAALGQLIVDEPSLFSNLMQKYYTPDNGDDIAFTPEERAFIARMRGQSFTAVMNPDRAPFSYFENGEPVGMISDLAKEISARSGLALRIVETADRAEYAALVEAGGVAVQLDAPYDYQTAEARGYRLTAPYLNLSVSRLYRRDKTRFSSLASLKNSDIERKYQTLLQNNYTVVADYDSVEALVQAVYSGAQDAAYLYHRSAELAVQQDETNRLANETVYGYNVSFALAVHAGQDHLLYSILKKTVASIGESQMHAIDAKYTTYEEKPLSFMGYMYNYPLHIIAFVFALCLLAVLLFMTVTQVQKRRRAAERLTEETRRAELLESALSTAESAGKAKSEFLSRMSHEMRTPLNAIIGFLSLAKDADGKQLNAYLGNSETAAKQLLSVINDVLDMSAIESGKMKLAHAPFDFKHMVHSVTNMFLSQCHEKGVSYETRLLTPVDERLVGDQLRVSQVLINLLSNAVKFTSAGHVYLDISQYDTPDGKAFLRFAVSDTGCGMTEEMQARLFMPFEQESAATARKYGGSGLGLSIVKNLVTMMNGALRVESRQGEGSTFTLDLPFDKDASGKDIPVPDGVQSLRVLAVDDDPVEREYILSMLARMGVRFACAESGDAALAELQRAARAGDAYNLCIVDWRMPSMNGEETTKRIRSKYGRNVIVIVVSSYAYHQVSESAREAGANLFVSKPLFQSSLFDLLLTLTGGRVAMKATGEVLQSDLSGRRVLLAEDNAMNRMVAVGLINKFGVECDTAKDGQLALELYLASEPGFYDAILMDIQMPNMDGFEATRAIRASGRSDARTVPIIALTANAFNEDIARALSNGMNAHVAKPIDPDLLLAALEQAFARSDREAGAL